MRQATHTPLGFGEVFDLPVAVECGPLPARSASTPGQPTDWSGKGSSPAPCCGSEGGPGFRRRTSCAYSALA